MIKLTTSDSRDLWVNINHIVLLRPCDVGDLNHAYLKMSTGDELLVTEFAHDIAEAIRVLRRYHG